MMLLLAILQDPALEAFDRARRELVEAFVERGPAALPDLDRLAKGDDPEIRSSAEAARTRIRELEPKIRRLVDELAARDIEVREKATLDLRRLGRAARWALEEALKSADEEVKVRAEFLSAANAGPGRNRSMWIIRSRLAAKALKRAEELHGKGLASAGEVMESRIRLLQARVRAGEMKTQTYLSEKRELLARKVARAEELHRSGITGKRDLLRAKLDLAYVDRRLGKVTEEELFAMQWALSEQTRALAKAGLANEGDPFEFMTDPDEDLDWREP